MALSYDIRKEPLLPLTEPINHVSGRHARQWQRLIVIGALVTIDALVLLAIFTLVYLLRFEVFGFLYVPQGSVLRFYSELVFWTIPPWLGVFAAYRLYDLRVLHGGTAEYRRITSACTFAIIVLLALSFFMDEKLIISRAWLLMVWITSIALLAASRFIVRRVLYRLRRYGIALTRVLLIGANPEAYQVACQLTEGRNQPGIELVGFVGERRTRPRLSPLNHPPAETGRPEMQPQALPNASSSSWSGQWFGLPNQVRQVVEEQQIDEVIIASTALSSEELFDVVHSLTTSKVEIRLSPSLYEILTTGLEVQEINGLPLVTVSKVRITGLNALLKRSLDILISAGALVAFSPILLAVGILVRLDSPGPTLYRRRVVGQGGQVFDAFKLRTMRLDGNEILDARPDLQEELRRTGKLKDDPRITGVGKFLRRTSLDELPQLFNVMLGQMSLVGPRMITYEEMVKFGRWQSNLVTVKPGLTGLWQISGRSNLTYDDRVRLDMHYIRNYSLWNDLRILFQTLPAVLRGTGAY